MARVLINEDFTFELSDVQEVSLPELLDWISYEYTITDVFKHWPAIDEQSSLINMIKEEY